MLHHYALEALSEKNRFGPVDDSVDSRKIREEVLGRHFDPKVKFARSTGKLTEDEALFCKLAHIFRNEAYHVGALHQDIILELTSSYHSIACNLFLSVLDYVTWTWGPNCPKLAKHLGVSNSADIVPDDAWGQRIVASLAALRPAPKRSFFLALHESISRRLQQIKDDMRFILRWDGQAQTLGEVINMVQRFSPPEGNVVTLSAVDRWTRRANRLKAIVSPGRALPVLTSLEEEIERFEENIRNGRADLEDQIEEILREKGLWPPKTKKAREKILELLNEERPGSGALSLGSKHQLLQTRDAR
jgi:hypothetical protein